MSHLEQMSELQRECAGCHRCSLADTRTNLVFGDGNPDAKIMLIGEGPGEQEDLSGIPFVGAWGTAFRSNVGHHCVKSKPILHL